MINWSSIPPEFLKSVELTLWLPTLSSKDVRRGCETAMQQQFASICLPTSRIAQAYDILQESPVRIVALVGYPHGTMESDAKRYEVEVAVDHDAHEIEMMVNVGRIKDGDYKAVLREIRDVVDAADERVTRVIIEPVLLTGHELEQISKVILDSGAKFISASTGLNGRAATVAELQRIREFVGSKFGMKAGGLDSVAKLAEAFRAGVNRAGLLAT